MSVIHLQNNCLRLISTENITEEVVFKAPSFLQDYIFQENLTNKGNWTIFCLEDTGNIYCMKSQQVNDQLRSPKPNSENQEIFSDLLEPYGDDMFEVECTESTVPVFKLQACHVVYKVNGKPLSICSYKDLLISLADYYDMYAFTVISLTRTCPGLAEDKPTVLFNKISKDQVYGRPTSCLMKIVTTDLIEGESATFTTNTLKIENDLFKSLFGSTTALLNSPVLLFCPPEGSVYNIPVHYLFKQFDSQSLLFETNIMDKQNNWKIFCETSSAVINLLTLVVPFKPYIGSQDIEKERDVQVLLICSHNGSVITYHFDSLHCKQELMSEFDIIGPVLGTDTYCNRIYHSTMTSIYMTSLEIINLDIGRNETHSNENIQIKDVKSRKQGMVYQIKVVANSSFTETTDSPCILHCVQKDGTHRLLDSTIFDQISDIPIEKSLVKDILVCIDQTDKDQQRLSEEIKVCDEWLEQISIASFLLNRQFSTESRLTGPGIGKLPINCNVKVMGNFQMPGQRHINLFCEITNQMPRHLSSDWSLEIFILPISYNACSKPHIQTTVIPLDNGLKTMESVEVTIAIPPDLILSSFDVLVTLTLNTRYCSATRNDKGTNLSILVIQERLDILHFLVSKQDSFSAARQIEKKRAISSLINALAHQQPAASCFIPDIDKCESNSRKVSIIKSLQFTKEMYDKLTDENGQDPVLKFLMKDSHLPPDDTTKNKCHVMSLIGNDLYLEVKDIQIQTRMKNAGNHPGEVIHAVLSIYGDMSTVAAVSMSIERKLKVDGLHHAGFPVTVGELKRFHHKIQGIDMDLQSLISKKTTNRDLKKEIGNIYHRVRSLQDIE